MLLLVLCVLMDWVECLGGRTDFENLMRPIRSIFGAPRMRGGKTGVFAIFLICGFGAAQKPHHVFSTTCLSHGMEEIHGI